MSDEFEEFLHHKVRKPKYGTPEWVYFEKELLSTFEGGRGYWAPARGKTFDWDEALRRVEEHLALYRQALPPPELVTNYERFMHTFDPESPR